MRIFLRFVNVVQNSKLDKMAIWTLIITLRFEYLKINTGIQCFYTFIPEDENYREYISENIDKLSQIAGVKNSQEIKINFSKNDLSDFAEMFIALNSCPSFLEKLYWKAFYKSKTTETITLLTSKIVKQSKPNMKSIALRVFAKITQVLGFKHIKFQHEVDQSFGKNVKLMKNIAHIKGENEMNEIHSTAKRRRSSTSLCVSARLPESV